MAKDRETPDRTTGRTTGRATGAGGANAPAASGRLVTLSDADYEVADNVPDPRGWDVLAGGRNGPKIGKVDELLVDPGAQRVRYLVVKLDDKIAGQKDRKVLVPVGVTQLDDAGDNVLVPERGPEFFAGLPPYEPGRFSRDYEDQLRARLGGAPAPAAGRDYYATETFDEGRLFRARGPRGGQEARVARVEEELAVGKRRAQAGEVGIRKTVETEHVSEQVPVMREEVEVERRPVEGAPAGPADMREEEIRVPLMAEEAVVEKRPVVKEEFVIRKRVVRDTQPVEADVRRERIDVERRQGEAARERDRRAGDEPRTP